MAAIVVQAATIFDIFWDRASYAALLVQVVIFLIFLVYPFFRVNVPLLLLAGGIILFLLAEHVVFTRISGQSYNFNAIFTYLPLLSFFPLYRSGCSNSYILRTLAIVSSIYVAIYVTGHGWIVSSAVGPSRSIHAGDAERGVRVYLAAGFASFVAYYVVSARGVWPWLRFALFGLAVAALWISGFRTFGILFAALLILSRLHILGFGVRLLLFALFALVGLLLLLGIVVPDWNPFVYMAWDGSAYARSLEYEYALRTVQHEWLFGVGVPSTAAALQTYLKTPLYEPVYPTDLGVVGPLLLFGVPGLIGYVAATYFCIVPAIRSLRAPEFQSLRLNAMLCAVLGVISPSLILEQNALFLSILIVAYMRGGAAWRRSGDRLWTVALPIESSLLGLMRPALRLVTRSRRTSATHYGPGRDR